MENPDDSLDKRIKIFAKYFLLPVWKWLVRVEQWPKEPLKRGVLDYLAAAFILLHLQQHDFEGPREQDHFLACAREILSPSRSRPLSVRSKPLEDVVSKRQLLVDKMCKNTDNDHTYFQYILLDFLCRVIEESDPSGSQSSEWREYDSILARRKYHTPSSNAERALTRARKRIQQLVQLLINMHAKDLLLSTSEQSDVCPPAVSPPATSSMPPVSLSGPAQPSPVLPLALDEEVEEYTLNMAELARLEHWIADAYRPEMPAITEDQTRDLFLWLEKPLAPGTTVFFVGDIHGDLLALAAVQTLFEAVKGPKFLVLLGDLIDRGSRSGAVVRAVARMLFPGSDGPEVVCLRGNHEDAVGYEAGKGYTSTVEPAEYIGELNRDSTCDDWFMRFVKTLPVAMYFQEGVFVSHGGLPLNDCFPYNRERLRCREYVQDFVWTRFSEDLPRKRPNRGSKTSEYGYEDIGKMLGQMEEYVLESKIYLYIRGHDHVKERFSIAAKTNGRVVTINAMSTSAGEAFGEPHRKPAIVRWVVGESPKIVRLVLPGNLIDEMNGVGAEAPSEVES